MKKGLWVQTTQERKYIYINLVSQQLPSFIAANNLKQYLTSTMRNELD